MVIWNEKVRCLVDVVRSVGDVCVWLFFWVWFMIVCRICCFGVGNCVWFRMCCWGDGLVGSVGCLFCVLWCRMLFSGICLVGVCVFCVC